MSSNSVVKNSILIGGFTFLGYLAGGKLGSMLGAAIGTVVSSLFDQDTVLADHHQHSYRSYRSYSYDDDDEDSTYVPARHRHHQRSNRYDYDDDTTCIPTRHQPLKSKKKDRKISTCSICLGEFSPSIVLIPCRHKCFCENCITEVVKKKVNKCPICRERIFEFRNVSSYSH